MGQFLPTDEQVLYDNIIHGLRSRDWSRTEAEDRALELIERRRERKKEEV